MAAPARSLSSSGTGATLETALMATADAVAAAEAIGERPRSLSAPVATARRLLAEGRLAAAAVAAAHVLPVLPCTSCGMPIRASVTRQLVRVHSAPPDSSGQVPHAGEAPRSRRPSTATPPVPVAVPVVPPPQLPKGDLSGSLLMGTTMLTESMLNAGHFHAPSRVYRGIDVLVCDSKDVTGPICSSCCVELDDYIDEKERARQQLSAIYRQFVRNPTSTVISGAGAPVVSEELTSPVDADQLQQRYAQVVSRLQAYQHTAARVREAQAKLQSLRSKVWQALETTAGDGRRARELHATLLLRAQTARDQLAELRAADPLLDAFTITIPPRAARPTTRPARTDQFATINNFQLAFPLRSDEIHPSEYWTEIQHGWREVARVLIALAARLQFSFSRVLLGVSRTHAAVHIRDKTLRLRLHATSLDIERERRQFHAGICGVLLVLDDLYTHAATLRHRQPHLDAIVCPHVIAVTPGSIGAHKISLTPNSSDREQFANAMDCMLECVAHLIQWSTQLRSRAQF